MSNSLVDSDGYLSENGDRVITKLIDGQRTKGRMMDISDYQIATKRIHELEQELETTTALCKTLTTIVNEGMHWLPTSEDAVFEDGELYLLNIAEEWTGLMIYGKKHDYFTDNDDCWYTRESITHYARITEPK